MTEGIPQTAVEKGGKKVSYKQYQKKERECAQLQRDFYTFQMEQDNKIQQLESELAEAKRQLQHDLKNERLNGVHTGSHENLYNHSFTGGPMAKQIISGSSIISGNISKRNFGQNSSGFQKY